MCSHTCMKRVGEDYIPREPAAGPGGDAQPSPVWCVLHWPEMELNCQLWLPHVCTTTHTHTHTHTHTYLREDAGEEIFQRCFIWGLESNAQPHKFHDLVKMCSVSPTQMRTHTQTHAYAHMGMHTHMHMETHTHTHDHTRT